MHKALERDLSLERNCGPQTPAQSAARESVRLF